MFLSTIFAIININNEKIIKGVYIQGMDVSNLTEEEAKNKLQQKAEEIYKKDIKNKEWINTYKPLNTLKGRRMSSSMSFSWLDLFWILCYLAKVVRERPMIYNVEQANY